MLSGCSLKERYVTVDVDMMELLFVNGYVVGCGMASDDMVKRS